MLCPPAYLEARFDSDKSNAAVIVVLTRQPDYGHITGKDDFDIKRACLAIQNA